MKTRFTARRGIFVRLNVKPMHYLVAGVAPIKNDEDVTSGYQGTLTGVHANDVTESEVLWRCDHRHRFARKAQECAQSEAAR